jgi:phosphatidylserine decarboxylase
MTPLLWALASLGAIAFAFGFFVLWARRVWFFRDPDHSNTPQDADAIRSPVYGIVAYVRKIEGGDVESHKLGERIRIEDITKDDWPEDAPSGEGWLIGIAMTALDVHYQYAPIPCAVESFCHRQTGRNLPMFDLWEYIRITWFRRWVQLFARRYVLENERQTMWLSGEGIKLALVLIADKFVDKIDTFVKPGDKLPAGGKLSFIGRGSQVDVVVCGHPGLQIEVEVGQAVKGPGTVLARRKR